MSTLTPSKRVLSVALAVLLAAAAGAVGPAVAAPTDSDTVAQTDATVPADDESNLTAEEIVQRHSDRLESMETISMTVRMNTSADQYSSSSTSELWIDFEDKQMRTESSSDYANTTTVRNDTGTVTYDADENTVRDADLTFEDMDPRETQQFALLLNNETELTYDGTERIDGTETYRLDVEPQSSSIDGEVDATAWISSETYMPVRLESSVEADNYSFESTVRFTDVRINETISDERFRLDVPDDAEKPEEYSTPDYASYDSESELRANTSQAVPDPTVPENYSFDSAFVTDGDDHSSVTMTYTDGDDGSISISQSTSSGLGSSYYNESDQYETVTIGNQTAYYGEFEFGDSNTSVLVWDDGDQRYSIHGSISRSAATDIAKSLVPSA